MFTQFVSVPGFQDVVWKVQKGSGMGLPGAGEISDAALLSMAELPYATDPEVQKKFGIHEYLRFKDDIFIVFDSPNKVIGEWLRNFRQRTRFFVIEMDKLSSSGVVMLDTFVSKGLGFESTGHLDPDLYEKPSSIKLPLSRFSAHNPAIHHHWPGGQIHRYKPLCSSKASYCEAVGWRRCHHGTESQTYHDPF